MGFKSRSRVTMIDKEIIIDGVNVAGCEFYCDEYCTLANDRNERLPFAEKCNGYDDCLYKQLQRKEHEYNSTLQENIVLLQQYNEKEQECERLNNIIETKFEQENLTDTALTYINDRYIYLKRDYKRLQAENEELKVEYDKTLTLLGTINNDRERIILQSQQDKNITDRYEQALEWIKNNPKYANYVEIQNKINEVLKDE